MPDPSADHLARLEEAFAALTATAARLETAYARLKTELTDQRETTAAVVAGLATAVVAVDADGEVALVNEAARRHRVDDRTVAAAWSAADDGATRFTWKRPDGALFSVTPTKLTGGGTVFMADDITAETRRRRQADRAERLSAAGSMSATLAHEIRNPLGSMELFADLLRREIEGDEEALKLLDRMCAGMGAINNVVSNYLLFTKDIKPVRNRFDIVDRLAQTMEFARLALTAQGMTIDVDLPDAPLFVEGDEGLIRQAILNLVRNAAQAMTEGGRFTLTLRPKGGRVEITAQDTGPGIAPELRDKVFDPFFTTKDDGAGLGLAIVSQIVAAHDGWTDVEETTGGAAILISLPIVAGPDHG
jgi:signal transduction histidine kinase